MFFYTRHFMPKQYNLFGPFFEKNCSHAQENNTGDRHNGIVFRDHFKTIRASPYVCQEIV